MDLNAKSEFVIDKDTGENLAIIDKKGTTDTSDDDKLLISRTAVVRMMIDEGMTDKKVEDLKQSELADLTEKYLESDYAKPADENKQYSLVDNYIKELGLKNISLKDLGILGDADYSDMNKILGNEENKKLVEKYIAEFLRADIITQQPHRTQGDDYVQINEKENYVDGGIFLWRVKEDEAFPDEDFDDAPEGTSEGEEDDDADYVRMQYVSPARFLQATGILSKDPYNYTTEEEIQEFIREKGLKELLKDQGEGRMSDEMDLDSTTTRQLMYCFTQDPDTDEIIMIKYTKEQSITGTFVSPLKNIAQTIKNAGNANAKYKIQLISMPYKDKIAKYIMPYEFLINLCMITQNPEFVYHVALMARDTYIVLKVQDKETIVRNTTDTERVAKTDKASGFKRRQIELTKEFTPTIQLRYANSWSWLEDFKYIKNYYINTWETEGPNRVAETEDYYEDEWTEQKEGYNDYGEPITQNSVEKSNQFLGMLRNENGKCKCEEEKKYCYPEKSWIDINDPVALDCMRKAVYEDGGQNVTYYVPRTNNKQAPLNKLDGGLQMLYAIMQSNYSGYKEWEKLLSNINETYSKAQEYLEKGDQNLFNNQYEEGEQNYKNAYIVKMQSSLEHLYYLMQFKVEDADLVIENPKPGMVYSNGVDGDVVCYLVDENGQTAGGYASGYTGGVSNVGDATWQNQITREEFIAIVQNYTPPYGMGEVTSTTEGYDTWFRPYAEQFYDISTASGLNPMYIFAMGIQESYYGSSSITYANNNTFGIGAYDWDPSGNAVSYGSQVEGIQAEVNLLKQYMTPGTWYYDSIVSMGLDPSSIEGQCRLYATDDTKAGQVISIMQSIFGTSSTSAGMGGSSNLAMYGVNGMGAPSGSTYAETGETGTEDPEYEPTTNSTSQGNQAIAIWAEQQIGKSVFNDRYQGVNVDSSNHCAWFAAAAIWEGTGFYHWGNANDFAVENSFASNASISSEEMSKIPVGAYIRSYTSGGYEHISIYVGGGYVVEAGGSVVMKNKLNENDIGIGTYLGWTFITGSNGETSGAGSTSSGTSQYAGMYKCINYATGETWYTNSPYSSSSSSASASGIVSDISNDDIPWKIWVALRRAGFSEYAAAGVLGNIEGESSFDPTNINYDSGAYGLAQWRLDRYEGLQNYAASKGKDWTDVDTQIEYLISEILGDGSNYSTSQKSGYEGRYNDWEKATNTEEATYAFMDWFERPSDDEKRDSGPTRASAAQKWYNQFHGKEIPASVSSSGVASGAAYANASDSEKLNYLFPNGIPQSESELMQYLTQIEVPTTSREGVKGTIAVTVHKAIAQDVYDACKAAQDSGFKIYDIGGYREFGTDTAGKTAGLDYSQHCYGLAVDINPTENGEYRNGGWTSNWWWDPSSSEYSIAPNSVLVNTFKSRGWGWGGEWTSSKDYMHFSYMGT